jgi:hypothetical protein
MIEGNRDGSLGVADASRLWREMKDVAKAMREVEYWLRNTDFKSDSKNRRSAVLAEKLKAAQALIPAAQPARSAEQSHPLPLQEQQERPTP